MVFLFVLSGNQRARQHQAR